VTKLAWDKVGERRYETGVDRGVLYLPDASGAYNNGYAWNGLTTVTESPSGAESNPQYADNIKYLNLLSAEEFGGTIEAFTYPDEWGQCDGTAAPTPGVLVGQQNRRTFGLCYRTLVGNDLEGTDHGYKLHLVYGALAAPSEKAYATINDSPEALGFSWDFSTTPVDVPGTNPITGKPFKPTAILTIDSTEVDDAALSNLEDMLYGTEGTEPELPLPAEVIALFSGTVQTVTPTEPTFDSATNTITIPTVAGVDYKIDGEVVAAGPVVITEDTVVNAEPQAGYKFPAVTDDDWFYDFNAGA
jgi:hypothetical protein